MLNYAEFNYAELNQPESYRKNQILLMFLYVSNNSVIFHSVNMHCSGGSS